MASICPLFVVTVIGFIFTGSESVETCSFPSVPKDQQAVFTCTYSYNDTRDVRVERLTPKREEIADCPQAQRPNTTNPCIMKDTKFTRLSMNGTMLQLKATYSSQLEGEYRCFALPEYPDKRPVPCSYTVQEAEGPGATTEGEQKEGSDTGKIVGGVFGALGLLALVGIAVWQRRRIRKWIIKRKNRANHGNPQECVPLQNQDQTLWTSNAAPAADIVSDTQTNAEHDLAAGGDQNVKKPAFEDLCKKHDRLDQRLQEVEGHAADMKNLEADHSASSTAENPTGGYDRHFSYSSLADTGLVTSPGLQGLSRDYQQQGVSPSAASLLLKSSRPLTAKAYDNYIKKWL